MTDCMDRALAFLEDFGEIVEEVFRAYDDMCESDRRRLVRAVAERRFEAAVRLARDHASFKKASEDVRVERTPIVDEETGRSFVTVEGCADPEQQERYRNMTMEDSNR